LYNATDDRENTTIGHAHHATARAIQRLVNGVYQ